MKLEEKLNKGWKKFLKEDRQLDDEMAAMAQADLPEDAATAAAEGEEEVEAEDADREKDCPKRFHVPWGYTMGPVAEEDREYTSTGWYMVDPKSEGNFVRIGRQDIMAAECDPSLYDGKRYLVWLNQPAPPPGRKDRGRQPTWAERSAPGPEEGSIYRSEQIMIDAFDDFEDAKEEARDFATHPGGKEVLNRGGSIEVHDREDISYGHSISRKQAPEESPEEEGPSSWMENWRKHLKEALEVREALPGEMEAAAAGGDPGATSTERSPVEVDREEYVASKEEGEFSDVNALRAALEGTEFTDKQIANPDEGHEVISFTDSDSGEQVLPLKQVGSTIYFKLNDVYGGTYYKVEEF